MIQFRFGTKDMDKLYKKFERLQRKELRDKTYERLRRLTDMVMEEAKRRAPVKTGALRDSIKARSWKKSRNTPNKMRGVVYADYPNTGRRTKRKTKKVGITYLQLSVQIRFPIVTILRVTTPKKCSASQQSPYQVFFQV